MADDFSATTSTSGRVTVGGTASGNIEAAGDRDWFAVDLVAGRTYTINLRGRPTADGTLSDPYLRGIHDADGNLMAGTANDDGGDGYNSQVTFTATASGTYYLAAGAWGGNRGTYEVEVTDSSPAGTDSHPDPTPTPRSDSPADATPADADATRAGATDLGDITALQGPRFPRGTVDGSADRVDYYRFTLTEAKRVGLGLRQQDADADLYLEDADGNVLYRSTTSGTGNERIAQTLLAGTYYLRVESREAGVNAHVVRYGVSAPDPDALAALEQASGTAPNEAPTFAESSYAFDLAENADGGTNRVSLGTVAATDPEGTTLAYRLVGGNESGSFEVDAASGELFYTGAGEDFESGRTQFTLTVRASDGSETTDTTVNVNVTDVEETVDPPAADEDETAAQTVSEPEDEDLSADTATSGRVAVGEAATGDIASAGDRDWFAVELVAGRRYIIDLRGGPTDDGTLGDPYLYGIHDAAGNRIANTRNDDGGHRLNSQVTFTATETGTHYIAAGAYGSRQGTYEVEVSEALPMLRVADAEATEGDDPEMVFRVTLGSPSPGTVTVDYATADGTATAGEDYTAASGTLTFAPGEIEKTVRVAIIDDTVPDNGETFTLVLSNPSGVALGDAQATGTILNTEPSVSEPAGEDLPADDTTTGRVVLGDPATGEIGTLNDRDWFAVEMVAGVRYRIDIMGSDTGSGTLSDPFFHGLYDSDGNRVQWGRNDGGEGRNSCAFYTPDESGIYYIAAGAGAYRTGTYTVSVSLGDDHSDSTDTTGTVAVGGTATGDLEVRRDRDWFAVTLAAGEEYRIDLKGDSTGDGTLEDPFLLGIM